MTTDTTGIIYSAEDDYGISYYFAGNPTDNWVKFSGMYWRIIRINGDGTIRMIYQGSAANTTGEATQIGTSAFNTSYNDNMYVGYMYTSGNAHGLGTSSTIKGVLDSWYNSNLTSYAGNIDTNVGFCNDRQPSTSNSSLNSSGGTGTTQTYYAAYIRLFKGTSASSAAPSFKCEDSYDRFSTSIGLVTADEVSYAGGVVGKANKSHYLYTGQYYWTLSPSWFDNGSSLAWVFNVGSDGRLAYNHVGVARGVRPVINLKANIIFSSGNGTSSNPYIVS